MPKGTISKETVETRSYGKKLFLQSNSPNFGVAPRITAIRKNMYKHTYKFKREEAVLLLTKRDFDYLLVCSKDHC